MSNLDLSYQKDTKQKPLVTVISIVFNGQEYLEETILSVINQSYQNFEYIIVDGGSTDGTLEIIKKYQNHIDKWISEPDNGIYDAMNKGIDLARGKWLNFMNAGDIFHNKDTLEDIFTQNIDSQSALIAGTYKFKDNQLINFPLQKLNIVKYGDLISCHQALFFNKDLLGKDVYYNTKYKICADNDIMMRIVKNKYKIFFTNVIVTIFDLSGVSSNKRRSIFPERYQAILKNFGFITVIKALIFNKFFIKEK